MFLTWSSIGLIALAAGYVGYLAGMVRVYCVSRRKIERAQHAASAPMKPVARSWLKGGYKIPARTNG